MISLSDSIWASAVAAIGAIIAAYITVKIQRQKIINDFKSVLLESESAVRINHMQIRTNQFNLRASNLLNAISSHIKVILDAQLIYSQTGTHFENTDKDITRFRTRYLEYSSKLHEIEGWAKIYNTKIVDKVREFNQTLNMIWGTTEIYLDLKDDADRDTRVRSLNGVLAHIKTFHEIGSYITYDLSVMGQNIDKQWQDTINSPPIIPVATN